MTEKLLEGFEQFYADEYASKDGSMQRLVEEGQAPNYFIISCIDSRCNPGTIFRPAPGTFFAHKAMGAIVRPYKEGTALAAALQFAITIMKVPNLVILGHSHCGAIKALAENIDDPEIASFVEVARQSLDDARNETGCEGASEELLRATEKQTVVHSMENVMGYPSVAKALEEGRLNIKPWVFNLATGNIEEYSTDTQKFEAITNHSTEQKDTAA